MARRLIVDTGVLIASKRGRAQVTEVIGGGDDLVVAAVTVAELRTGVELATERHRAARAGFLARVRGTARRAVRPFHRVDCIAVT